MSMLDVKDKFVTEQKSLWGNEEYTDFTVKCGDRSWRVHRAVVCARSGWFKKEAAKGEVDIQERTPEEVEKLLLAMYTLEFEGADLKIPDKTNPGDIISLDAFKVAVDMVYLADFFDIPTLIGLAAAKIEKNADELWKFGLSQLKIMDDSLDQLVNILGLLYSHPNIVSYYNLRKAVGDSMSRFYHLLARKPQFKELVGREIPALAGDILTSILLSISSPSLAAIAP